MNKKKKKDMERSNVLKEIEEIIRNNGKILFKNKVNSDILNKGKENEIYCLKFAMAEYPDIKMKIMLFEMNKNNSKYSPTIHHLIWLKEKISNLGINIEFDYWTTFPRIIRIWR